MARQQWLLFHRTRVQSPAITWQLTPVCDASSWEFLTPSYKRTCRDDTNDLKNKNKLYKKEP